MRLDFSAVAERGSQIEGFREELRWQALAAFQQEYLRVLDRHDLWDLQTARLYAIQHKECRTESQIVLVGMVDLNRSQRMMLDQVADHVTALVLAPPELADHFDNHGCLRPEAWLDIPIPLTTEQIDIVGDQADQAEAVVRAIAAMDGQYSAEQIVIGVPDEEIVPYVEQHLRQCKIPARYGPGRPLASTYPAACWLPWLITLKRPAFPPSRRWCAILRYRTGWQPRESLGIALTSWIPTTQNICPTRWAMNGWAMSRDTSPFGGCMKQFIDCSDA